MVKAALVHLSNQGEQLAEHEGWATEARVATERAVSVVMLAPESHIKEAVAEALTHEALNPFWMLRYLAVAESHAAEHTQHHHHHHHHPHHLHSNGEGPLSNGVTSTGDGVDGPGAEPGGDDQGGLLEDYRTDQGDPVDFGAVRFCDAGPHDAQEDAGSGQPPEAPDALALEPRPACRAQSLVEVKPETSVEPKASIGAARRRRLVNRHLTDLGAVRHARRTLNAGLATIQSAVKAVQTLGLASNTIDEDSGSSSGSSEHGKFSDMTTALRCAVALDAPTLWYVTTQELERMGKRELNPLHAVSSGGDLMSTWASIRHHLHLGWSYMIMDPYGLPRGCWDMLSLLFVAYLGVVVPFDLGFEVNLEDYAIFRTIDIVITWFFLVDVVLNFLTAVPQPHSGELIRDHMTIAKIYLTTSFVSDVLVSFPYSAIFPAAGNTPKLLRAGRVVKLIRLVKMSGGPRLLAKLLDSLDPRLVLQTVTLLKLVLLLFVVFGHWLACFWHGIGLMRGPGEPGVLHVCRQGTVLQSCRWIDAHFGTSDLEASLWDRYVASVYFALGSMSTLGSSITAMNTTEELVSTLYAVIAAAVFSILAASLSGVVASGALAKEEKRSRLYDLIGYMRRRAVPKDLQIRVRKYASYRMENTDETGVNAGLADMLSPHLYAELTASIRGFLLRQFYPFKRTPHDLLCELAQLLETEIHAVGDFVVEQDDIGTGMYFQATGTVAVYTTAQALAAAPEPLSAPPDSAQKWPPEPVSKVSSLVSKVSLQSSAISALGAGPVPAEQDSGWRMLPPPPDALLLQPGSHFGEVALFVSSPPRRAANVRVVDGPMEAMHLERGRFRDYIFGTAHDSVRQQFTEMCQSVDRGDFSVLGMRCGHCHVCHAISESCSRAIFVDPKSLGESTR